MEKEIMHDLYSAVINDGFPEYSGLQTPDANPEWAKMVDMIDGLDDDLCHKFDKQFGEAIWEDGLNWFKIGFSFGQRLTASAMVISAFEGTEVAK